MHQKLIDEGLSIMEEVNDIVGDARRPFSVLGSFRDSSPKSFWMKVQCFYCRDLLSLCPPKKNLESNLRHHLASAKHVQALQNSNTTSNLRPAILTGQKGQPFASSGVSVYSNQPDLGRWWSLGRVPTKAEEGGESSTSGRNAFLGLLCWGYRGPTCTYADVSYSVIDVLHDSHVGRVWYPEPHVTTNVIRNGQAFKIEGTFRHTSCTKVVVLGDGFINLSCSMCSGIPLEADFRKWIMREDLTSEKRGTRCTGGGRRLGYLQLSELAKHGQDLRRKLKVEKLLHFSARARIVQLKVKRPSLRELARDASGSHNALKFCHSILNAHRCGAFGGKPALWDFLHDVAQNVSQDDRGIGPVRTLGVSGRS